MKWLIPVFMLLVGSGAGVAAGIFFAGDPEEQPTSAPEKNEHESVTDHESDDGDGEVSDKEYVSFSNQFVVPIVKENMVSAMVVLSLTVEVGQGQEDAIYDAEPKLRDAFLRVLFDFSNVGGFDGYFTDNTNLDVLRRSLKEVGAKTMGQENLSDVLISDIARQDF